MRSIIAFFLFIISLFPLLLEAAYVTPFSLAVKEWEHDRRYILHPDDVTTLFNARPNGANFAKRARVLRRYEPSPRYPDNTATLESIRETRRDIVKVVDGSQGGKFVTDVAYLATDLEKVERKATRVLRAITILWKWWSKWRQMNHSVEGRTLLPVKTDGGPDPVADQILYIRTAIGEIDGILRAYEDVTGQDRAELKETCQTIHDIRPAFDRWFPSWKLKLAALPLDLDAYFCELSTRRPDNSWWRRLSETLAVTTRLSSDLAPHSNLFDLQGLSRARTPRYLHGAVAEALNTRLLDLVKEAFRWEESFPILAGLQQSPLAHPKTCPWRGERGWLCADLDKELDRWEKLIKGESMDGGKYGISDALAAFLLTPEREEEAKRQSMARHPLEVTKRPRPRTAVLDPGLEVKPTLPDPNSKSVMEPLQEKPGSVTAETNVGLSAVVSQKGQDVEDESGTVSTAAETDHDTASRSS